MNSFVSTMAFICLEFRNKLQQVVLMSFLSRIPENFVEIILAKSRPFSSGFGGTQDRDPLFCLVVIGNLPQKLVTTNEP